MSETSASYYIMDSATLDTVRQVTFSDEVETMLQTAHGQLLPDGRFVNLHTQVSRVKILGLQTIRIKE